MKDDPRQHRLGVRAGVRVMRGGRVVPIKNPPGVPRKSRRISLDALDDSLTG